MAKKLCLTDLLKSNYSTFNYSPDVPLKFWSRDSLYKRMFLFYNLTELGKGKIYYLKENKIERNHFKTRFPTYFNLD